MTQPLELEAKEAIKIWMECIQLVIFRIMLKLPM